MSFSDFLEVHVCCKLHIYMNILFYSIGKPCHHNRQGFSSFYHLSLSSKIKPILSLPDFEWVMQAFISALLDYSKAFYAHISPPSNGRLQTVLNVIIYLLRQQDSGARYHHPGSLAPLASRIWEFVCPLINKRLGPSVHLRPLACLYTLKVPEAQWSAATGRPENQANGAFHYTSELQFSEVMTLGFPTNGHLSWNFRSERQRNLDNPEFTVQDWVTAVHCTIYLPPALCFFGVIKKSYQQYCATSTCYFCAFMHKKSCRVLLYAGVCQQVGEVNGTYHKRTIKTRSDCAFSAVAPKLLFLFLWF